MVENIMAGLVYLSSKTRVLIHPNSVVVSLGFLHSICGSWLLFGDFGDLLVNASVTSFPSPTCNSFRCVLLNQWELAVNLAQQHNFQQIEGANKQGGGEEISNPRWFRPFASVSFRRFVMLLDVFWQLDVVLDLLAMMHKKTNHKKIGK